LSINNIYLQKKLKRKIGVPLLYVFLLWFSNFSFTSLNAIHVLWLETHMTLVCIQ